MRTVLVCVRSSLAAQQIASAAARLGLSSAVRTAASAPEVMLRLTERPAEVVLADTTLTRPDSAGFVRRVLARAPQAAVLLLGAEEPNAAAATISAGARGLIQGTDHDLATAVAKALLLLAVGERPGRRMAAVGNGREVPLPAEAAAKAGGAGAPAARPDAGAVETAPRAGEAAAGPAVVPVQRGDDEPEAPAGDEPAPGAERPRGTPARGGAERPVALTERELQVLLGMADGKSNAEIGRELFVSEDTVKTHARRLFRKLGARDRAHAVAAGFRAGLVA